MKNNLYINSFSSISALGNHPEEIWRSYLQALPLFTAEDFEDEKTYVSQLNQAGKVLVKQLQEESTRYENLDPSVLYAIITARQVGHNLEKNTDIGVNIGSSRGATGLFEKYHQQYLQEGKTSPLASPTTTLGNISSWVLQDLGSSGPEISHSITCSTALHGLLNAAAWLKSGMAKQFIVGGSEAPLTKFTIAQMKAVKLYALYNEREIWPNRSLEIDKQKNTMILGEASASFFVSKSKEDAIVQILGLGYASEKLTHNISISKEAKCLQQSMQKALKEANLKTVDAIVAHAPGTRKGDWAEINAIKAVFPEKIPLITSNKFLIGHTFGASGGMSLEMAILMIQHQQFIPNPFFLNEESISENINTVMVNAVGFGGNAVSVIISKLDN
ncbi:beta-ketoacyl synthase N-terminal-like domain-containing protein [Mesonia aestuariivivens]|uniref:Beta-ketoacyl synthase n=1 Tax=Mesonia aestuariivivens TaxID=2796128 RepID=A0ABS6VYL2_9FLAO|nr:beta-ketoacyl synthase N-terminal-like domain-containing protein [Mesonia aestuariivivens]MBW2960356.1 beta-ketoacyl synthase [Mesonia aestuariivivens]